MGESVSGEEERIFGLLRSRSRDLAEAILRAIEADEDLALRLAAAISKRIVIPLNIATKEDLKALEAVFKAEISRLDQRIASEVSRLDQRITSEVSRLDQRISDLENTLKTEVSRLDQRITDEVSKLDQRIASEVSRLDQRITSEVSRLDQRISDLENTLKTEVSRLDQRITDEVSKLDQRIASEVSRLDQRITTETSTIRAEIKDLRGEIFKLKTDVKRISRTLENITISIEEEARIVVERLLKEGGLSISLSPLVLDKKYEFDLYGAGDGFVIVGEAKTRASEKTLKRLLKRVEEARNRWPEKFGGKVVIALYCLRYIGDPKEAEEKGVWLIESTRELTKVSIRSGV